MRLFLIFAVPLALILYGHALEAPLYLDDGMVLETEPFRGLSTRSLGYLSFAVSAAMAEVMTSLLHWEAIFYFRLGNLLIHVLVATLLVGLGRELSKSYGVGLVAGAIFLLHPALSQPVLYVTQRFESLATLFMVAAALAYARFRGGAESERPRWPARGSPVWMVGAIVFALAAALTKETAVVLPVWILLMEFTFYGGLPRGRALGYVALAGAVLAIPALWAFQSSANTLTSVPWDRYLMSQGFVLLTYLQLSVFPLRQYLVYAVEVVGGVSWALVGAWLAVVAILATGIAVIRRYPLVGFGIVTFFVLLLPVTLLPLPDLVFEHRLYPGFVGLALAFGAIAGRGFRPALVGAVCALLIVYGARTYQRAAEWTDDVAFFEAHRERFPASPRILADLAVRYYARGEVNRGLELLEEARRNEDSFNAYYSKIGRINTALNIMTMSMAKQDFDRARAELDRALALDPDEGAVRRMEGSFYLSTGDPERALEAFTRLTELDPTGVVGWIGVRDAAAVLGREDLAREADARVEEYMAELPTPLRVSWRVPDEYRLLALFAVLLVLMGSLVGSAIWVWSEVRHRWFEWQNEKSSSS